MWAFADTPDTRCIEDGIKDIILADELGYDSCWIGEHHQNRDKPLFGRMPQPELLIAHLAAETRKIRLGTGVKVLPFDTPSRFAEAIVVLDILTKGRVSFGVGMSMRSDKLSPTHDRGAEFRAQLSQLMHLLDKQVGTDVEPITPEPLRDYRGLIWVAAREAATVAHAAGLGLNFVVGQLEQASKQREFVDTYRHAGGKGEIRGVRMVHVADSDDEAWHFVEPAARRMYQARAITAYGRLAAAEGRLATSTTDDPSEMMRQIELIAGSPRTVADALVRYMEAARVDRVDVMMHVPDIDHEAIVRSMHLFAREVLPVLRGRKQLDA